MKKYVLLTGTCIILGASFLTACLGKARVVPDKYGVRSEDNLPEINIVESQNYLPEINLDTDGITGNSEDTSEYYSRHRIMDFEEFMSKQVAEIGDTIKIHPYAMSNCENEIQLKLNTVSFDENGDCHVEICVEVFAKDDVFVPAFYQHFQVMYLNASLNIPDDDLYVYTPYIEDETSIRYAKIKVSETGQNSTTYEETESKEDTIILSPGQNILKFKYLTSQLNCELEGFKLCLSNLTIPEVTKTTNKYGNISYVFEIEYSNHSNQCSKQQSNRE